MPDGRDGNWLAIDYGERLIGLAVAHPLTGSARPLEPIRQTGRDQLEADFATLLSTWHPVCIVIGLPLDSRDQETAMSARVRKFARWLTTLAPAASIEMHDERLTSESAAREFARRRSEGRARKRDAARLDSMAAALILESWMTEHGLV